MKTKIIATLGPASMNADMMRAMVDNGVRIFRFNFSHAAAASFVPAIGVIRDIERETGIPLTAMGDLCGPKTRIGEVCGACLDVDQGSTVLMGLPSRAPASGDVAFMPLDFPELLAGLEPGMSVCLNDGQLHFQVEKVLAADELFELSACNAGALASNKGVVFPGKAHAVPALTDKDRVDLREGLDAGLDAFALSFVQTPRDIQDLIEAMEAHGRRVPVVAKIERQNALEHLDGLLELCDALMVARGDLGLECPLSQVPVIQKRIIRACRHAQKAAIVATQMLHSMVANPMPTRAEASDVGNAMVDGADCVMLSEETAVGDYPLEAVKMMRSIAENAEAYYQETRPTPFAPREGTASGKFLAYAACVLADNFDSAGLVCHSVSGATARYLSSRRSSRRVFALSPDVNTRHALNFFWGVTPLNCDESEPDHMARVEAFVAASDRFVHGQSLVLSCNRATPGQRERFTNMIQVYHK